MIYVQVRRMDLQHPWGLYLVFPGPEVIVKLSEYFRIYIRPRKSWLFPHGLNNSTYGRWGIFEPGWAEYAEKVAGEDFCPHWAKPPRPSTLTKFIAHFVPKLNERIEKYKLVWQWADEHPDHSCRWCNTVR